LDVADNGVNTPYNETVEISERSGKALLRAKAGTSYTLFVEAETIFNIAGLLRHLEAGLAENFHYAECRALGQLSPARVFQIRQNSKSAEAVFLDEMHSRGIKYGDVKLSLLDRESGWEQRFGGDFISPVE